MYAYMYQREDCMYVSTGRLHVTKVMCSSIFFPDCLSSSYESFDLFFNSIVSNVASRGEDSSITTSPVSVDNMIWLCVVQRIFMDI